MLKYFQDEITSFSIKWLYTRTMIDFTEQNDYTMHSLEQFAHDYIRFDTYTYRRTKLLINDVTLRDSIKDPFEDPTDELSFLQANNYDLTHYSEEGTTYWHAFVIDDTLFEQSRSRYSLWHLLADAGGLYDGLSIIVWMRSIRVIMPAVA